MTPALWDTDRQWESGRRVGTRTPLYRVAGTTGTVVSGMVYGRNSPDTLRGSSNSSDGKDFGTAKSGDCRSSSTPSPG
jgi:hypothetical protein